MSIEWTSPWCNSDPSALSFLREDICHKILVRRHDRYPNCIALLICCPVSHNRSCTFLFISVPAVYFLFSKLCDLCLFSSRIAILTASLFSSNTAAFSSFSHLLKMSSYYVPLSIFFSQKSQNKYI